MTRLLEAEGILDYSGHVSTRIPGRDAFVIQIGSASRAEVEPASMLICDYDGTVLEGDGAPPVELPRGYRLSRTSSQLHEQTMGPAPLVLPPPPGWCAATGVLPLLERTELDETMTATSIRTTVANARRDQGRIGIMLWTKRRRTVIAAPWRAAT